MIKALLLFQLDLCLFVCPVRIKVLGEIEKLLINVVNLFICGVYQES